MATSRDVIALIESAFASVRRPAPDQISHCDECDLWVERFLESDVADWRDLSPDDISYEYAALTAVTPAGWRFLVPAYLVWYVKNPHANSNTHEHLLWQLTLREDDDDHQRTCFESLDRRQARAVVAFLDFVAENSELEHCIRDARIAYESYWRRAGA